MLVALINNKIIFFNNKDKIIILNELQEVSVTIAPLVEATVI